MPYLVSRSPSALLRLAGLRPKRRSTSAPRRASRRSRASGGITTSRSSRPTTDQGRSQQDLDNIEPKANEPDFDDSTGRSSTRDAQESARRPARSASAGTGSRSRSRPRPRASRSSSRRRSTTTARSGSTASSRASRADAGGPIVAGFNVPNRVELKDAKPGKIYSDRHLRHQRADLRRPRQLDLPGPDFLELSTRNEPAARGRNERQRRPRQAVARAESIPSSGIPWEHRSGSHGTYRILPAEPTGTPRSPCARGVGRYG